MSLHVSPRGTKWAVRRSGKTRAWKVFDTQEQALAFAKRDGELPVLLWKQDGLCEKVFVNPATEEAMKRLAAR